MLAWPIAQIIPRKKKVFSELIHDRMMMGRQRVNSHEEITGAELYIKKSLVTLIRVQNYT